MRAGMLTGEEPLFPRIREDMATVDDTPLRKRAGAAADPKYPFLVYGGGGRRRLFGLHPGLRRVTIGRGPSNDITLSSDTDVARVHAELVRVGDAWTLVDEGLSRGGTWVNGDRITGRHRLRDGDVVQVGRTQLAFRIPKAPRSRSARAKAAASARPAITPTQRKVLEALCRPYKESEFATPATNQAIAEELFLSVDAVQAHLRALVAAFGLTSVPPTQRRAQLALRAMQHGHVE
jgi:hypothetical protein